MGRSGAGYWISGYIAWSFEGKPVTNPGCGGLVSSSSISGASEIASSPISSAANISASGSYETLWLLAISKKKNEITKVILVIYHKQKWFYTKDKTLSTFHCFLWYIGLL